MAEEVVTFYAWQERAPSSMTMRVFGGEMQKDSITGAIRALEHYEIKFSMGILHLDPEDKNQALAIKELRKQIKKGASITEDKEEYLSHVEPQERRQARLAKKNASLESENSQLHAEIKRLTARINAKEQKAAEKQAAG